MKRFCEAFLKLEKGIGGALLLLMLVVVFFATVGRYTGLYNMSWSDEAARYRLCFSWRGSAPSGERCSASTW